MMHSGTNSLPTQVLSIYDNLFLYEIFGTCFFSPPDTIQLTTGMLFGVTSGVTYPGDMLYVMPEHIFTTNGTIVAVEFISDTAGVVYIQVDFSIRFEVNNFSCKH